MGLLTEGSPLTWQETKKLSHHVQKHGIQQFINMYQRLRDRQGDVLKWGDEVICYVFYTQCVVRIALNKQKIETRDRNFKCFMRVFVFYKMNL